MCGTVSSPSIFLTACCFAPGVPRREPLRSLQPPPFSSTDPKQIRPDLNVIVIHKPSIKFKRSINALMGGEYWEQRRRDAVSSYNRTFFFSVFPPFSLPRSTLFRFAKTRSFVPRVTKLLNARRTCTGKTRRRVRTWKKVGGRKWDVVFWKLKMIAR